MTQNTEREQAIATQEPLVRYCPGCGSIGTVDAKYRDCCPDGNEARMIPQPLAEKCRATFKLAIRSAMADAAANDAAPATQGDARSEIVSAIQHAVNNLDISGLDIKTPRQREYVKAGARLAIDAVNAALKENDNG